jgi:hypothetical protein
MHRLITAYPLEGTKENHGQSETRHGVAAKVTLDKSHNKAASAVIRRVPFFIWFSGKGNDLFRVATKRRMGC